jgi:hypothetical protein
MASQPIFKTQPGALTFSACPKLDDTMRPVPDVFPDVKRFTLVNEGRGVGLILPSFSPANGPFSIVVDGGLPRELEQLSELDIAIAFSPTRSGEVGGSLVFDKPAEGAEAVTPLTLSGTGIARPALATLQAAIQPAAGTTQLQCNDPGSPVADCELGFPATLYGESVVRTITYRNAGCPALKITGLALEPQLGGTAGDIADFEIIAPATLPSAANPIILSQAGTEELTVQVRFRPAPNASMDTGRAAVIRVTSNDTISGGSLPTQPSVVSIQAEAIVPSLTANPGTCDFSQSADLCGNMTKIENQAKFDLTNNGNAPIRIESVMFMNGGVMGRFAVMGANPQGSTLMPGQTTVLNVTHTQQPLYVTDTIVVSASVMGGMPGSGGRVSLPIYGGVRPCMSTDPATALLFANPTEELTARTVTIRNGMGCGTLTVNSVRVTDGTQFFSLIDPMLMVPRRLNGGESAEVTVQYKLPAIGGLQTGNLRIASNDTSSADNTGTRGNRDVLLQSDSMLDPNPEAFLTICSPGELMGDAQCRKMTVTSQQVSAVYRLSEIAEVGGIKTLTLSGIRSTDAAPGMVATYRFNLTAGAQGFPPGVTTANLTNHNMFTAVPTTTLKLGGSGVYNVALRVTDNRMKQSANVTMNINVLP